MALVVISGRLDISVGSTAFLSSAIGALLGMPVCRLAALVLGWRRALGAITASSSPCWP